MKYFLKTTFQYINLRNILFSIVILVTSIILNIITGNSNNSNIFLFFNGVSGPGILSLSIIFVVVLPSSLSLYEDMKNEYIKNILIRMNYKRYFFSKVLSTGLISGILVSFVLLFFLMVSLNFGRIPNEIVDNFTTGAFHSIYPKSKIIYALLFIMNSFVFSFVFSIFGMITTLFWKNKYAPSIVTFFIYFFTEPFFSVFKLNKFGFTNLFNYSSNYLTTPRLMYSEFLIILIFTLIIGYYKFKRVFNVHRQ